MVEEEKASGKRFQFSVYDCFCGENVRHYMFLALVAVLAVLTVKDVILLVSRFSSFHYFLQFIDYCENPKQANMKMIFDESMSMPNITFCLGRNTTLSHLDLDGIDLSSSSAETNVRLLCFHPPTSKNQK